MRRSRQTIGLLALAVLALGLPAAASARSFADEPDDLAGPQLHFLYIVPFDGPDRQLDENGTIANETQSFGRWLADQTGGRGLREDLRGGALDVTFVRLNQLSQSLYDRGVFIRDSIESELRQRHYDAPDKLYVGYYDGPANSSCGLSAWTGGVAGNLALVLPLATPAGAPPCSGNPFASPGGPPGYLEFAALHETLHVIGFAPSCARHFAGQGHVNDDPRDLMYAGPLPWQPSILDVGHDDYFQAGIPGCPDLSASPFLTSVPAAATPAAAAQAGASTSARVKPKLTLRGATRVRRGHRFRLVTVLTSTKGAPAGACVLRRQKGRRYVQIAHAGVHGGTCTFRLRAPRHGATLRYRISFLGAPGWSNATVTRTVHLHR